MSKIDLFVLISYLVGILFIGIYASRKQEDMETYYVGARKFGTFSIMALWFSSWIGGAAVVGTAATAYEFGISGIWYVLGSVFGCFIFGITASERVSRIGEKASLLTYADLIDKFYGNRTSVVAAITTLLGNIGFTAGQFAAAGSILHLVFGLNYTLSFVLATIIVIIYTAFGGLMAVTYTDWIQFFLIMLGIVVMGIPSSLKALGGIASLESLPAGFLDIGNWGWMTILGLTVSTVFSFYTSMDSFTKSFSAKDEKSASRGTIWAGVTMILVGIGAVLIGLAGKVLYPGLSNANEIAYMIILNHFPKFFTGVALVGVLSAIMSSADILLLQASANVSRDLFYRLAKEKPGEDKLMKISVISSVVAGFLAMLIAIKMQNVISILYMSMTINSAGLFVPTIAAIFYDCRDGDAAFWSILITLIIVVSWYLLASLTPIAIFEIDPIWPGLLVSFISFMGLLKFNKPVQDN